MESQGSHEKSRKFSRIPILWPWELPARISGTVAVFDIYAATTNIASFLARRARNLLLVNEDNLEVAKQKHPQALVIGESRQLPPDVFDYSNKPSAHADVDLSGQSILYISDNGTRVVEQVLGRGQGRPSAQPG